MLSYDHVNQYRQWYLDYKKKVKMSTTYPLPYHPPTHLPIGEVVYLISGKLDRNKTLSTYEIYSKIMSPSDILEMFIIDSHVEAVAKRKSSGELIKISTHMLGYIISDLHYSTAQAVMQSTPMRGYNIRWEQAKNHNSFHHIFEDEESIVSLRDLIILDGEQLYNEVKGYGQSK